MMGLTPRQRDVYNFLCNHISAHGCAPSIREIAVGTGLAECSVGTVHSSLKALEQRGHIRRSPKQRRAIEIINHSITCPNCGHEFSNSAAGPSPTAEALEGSSPPAKSFEGPNSVVAA